MIEHGIVLGHVVSSRGIEVDKAKIDIMFVYLSLKVCKKYALFFNMQASIVGL